MVLFYVNRPGEPGIILWEVAVAALCFEVLYRSFGVLFRVLAARQGVALDRKRRPTFARDGNSYAVSFVHATIVVVRGFQHLIQQYGAPLEAKFVQQPYGSSNAWAAGAAAIEPTNTIFLAFLAYDVSHVLLEYPRLGGVDVVAHHVLFAAASYVCGSNSLPVWKSTSELGSATTSRRWPENSTPSSRCSYGDKWGGPKFDLHTGVFPWPFAWLIIGELSTLPLNLRWVLIQSGRGGTRLMRWTTV